MYVISYQVVHQHMSAIPYCLTCKTCRMVTFKKMRYRACFCDRKYDVFNCYVCFNFFFSPDFPDCNSQGLVSCDRSRCIPEHDVCDGKYDCLDHSDEEQCGNGGAIFEKYTP